MADGTATPTEEPERSTDDDIVDAEIVDDAPAPTDVADTAVAASPVDSASPAQHIVYLHAPAAPRKKGNRGIGALYAVASGVVFAAVLAVVTALIRFGAAGSLEFSFLANALFYIPVLLFIVGFVLLVIVLNRAAWWAYILGSLLLAVFVFFGTVGWGLLSQGVIALTPDEAAVLYAAAVSDPFVIASAFIAREVSIWVGAAIASRGRRVKTRNVEARAAYDKDLAAKRSEHERGAVAPPSAV